MTHKIERLEPSLLVAIHNGKESGQEVPHVHVHLIPRQSDDSAGPVHSMFDKRPKFTDAEFDDIAEKLRE
jgi:histidine triad (HIT) family protein